MADKDNIRGKFLKQQKATNVEHRNASQQGKANGSSTIILYRCADHSYQGNLFHALLQVINGRESRSQTSADAVSMLCCYIPSFMPKAREVFQKLGFKIQDRAIENEHTKTEEFQDLTARIQKRSGYLFFGQIVSAVFKDINSANFDSFMQKRSAAISAHVGVWIDTDVYPVCLDIRHARSLRQFLGAQYQFKKHLFEFILSGRKQGGIEGGLCNYLCNILQWYQMTHLKIIYDKIVLPESPILSDCRIKDEVNRFTSAFDVATDNGPIEYFMIMARPELQAVIEKNRFKTLIAVAQAVSFDEDIQRINFHLSGIQSNLVADLVRIHHQPHEMSKNGKFQQAMDLLMNGFPIDPESPPRRAAGERSGMMDEIPKNGNNEVVEGDQKKRRRVGVGRRQ